MEKQSQSFRSKIIMPLAVLMLAVVIGVFVINKKQQEVKQLNSANVELETVIGERDSVVNELISAFDSIEQNLTFINERRGKLVIENNETTNPSKKEAIIRDIQLMNTMLEESSLEIEELEKKLKDSGIQLRSFKNKIASLNKNINSQNSQIDEFKLQIEQQNERIALVTLQKDSLQNQVLSFRDSINYRKEILAQKDELIHQQVNEINKCFFASGTYKELFDNGVVSKEGGFLGFIGKNKILQNNMNEEYFTQLDIVENRSITLNAKKANLISEHPTSSYKLVEEDGLITKLEIEYPEEFWRITNYAVIEVK